MNSKLALALTGIMAFTGAFAVQAVSPASVDIRDTLEQLDNDIAALERIIAIQKETITAQQDWIEELIKELDLDEVPPRIRPTVPPVDPPDIVVPPSRGMAGAPERVDPIRPSRTRVDAHVFPGRYEIGGKSFPGLPADAYAAVDETLRGEGVIVLGIYGDVGRVSLGHAYSKWSDDKFEDKDSIGIQVVFIGLDAGAAVGPIFLGSRDEDRDKFDPVDTASFFDIGIKGESGTYAFRQHGWIREMIWDRVWIKPHPVTQSMSVPYLSAFNFHKDWDSLTLKAYEPRGLQLGEHVAYIKGGGFTQILDCNLFGGRRTGFQDRSHGDDGSGHPSPKRHGAFIADGNFAEGFGWNHINESGGQWMTVWSSLEFPVRISNNTCTDARYGCLGISKGVTSSDPYVTDDGWSHSNVYIWGNTFENKRAKRSCVSITDVRDGIHFGTGNDFTGPDVGSHTMVFGSQWGFKNAGTTQPEVWKFYSELPTWPVHRYMPETDTFELITFE
tara:strand:+ start:1558 stop:3060 length:1503 start_codon:yes stop_codon:yes gene_type:complete